MLRIAGITLHRARDTRDQHIPAMRVLPVVLICRRQFACAVGQISGSFLRVPPARGALRDRHETWAGMRWMRRPRMTSAAGACGKTAWSCPPDAGVKFVDDFTSDGGYNARYTGEIAA